MKDKIERVKALGYPEIVPVASLLSISQLFGKSKSRCGVYLLEFPDSLFYIGQAKDVVKRFAQHRRNHSDIIGFSFVKTPKSKLDEVEKNLIHEAENLGFLISNIVHATDVVGETDFDYLVSPKMQSQWLENPVAVSKKDTTSRIDLPLHQQLRTQKKYKKFQSMSLADDVRALLWSYAQSCLPLPRKTEYSFWSMSCMPSTNVSTWPRMAVVNLSVMEVFVVGFHKNNHEELWGFIVVASDVLLEEFGSENKFRSMFPFVDVYQSTYRDAGQYQVCLRVDGVNRMKALLEDHRVQKAAGKLNLRLMKKRATIYGKNHCSELASSCVF